MGNLFDLIVLVVIGLFAFFGLRKGLVESVIKLIGLILATYGATKFHYLGADLVKNFFKNLSGVQTVAGFLLVFLVIYLFFVIVLVMLKNIIRSLKLVWVDRLGGILFGVIKGLIILSIFVWILSIFPESGIGSRFKSTSLSYSVIERFETSVAKAFRLEEDLGHMSSKIRQLFFLPA